MTIPFETQVGVRWERKEKEKKRERIPMRMRKKNNKKGKRDKEDCTAVATYPTWGL